MPVRMMAPRSSTSAVASPRTETAAATSPATHRPAMKPTKAVAVAASRPMLSKSSRIARPSGPVVRDTAAMAFATASSAGAKATASWLASPRQISPSRDNASLVRSICRASWSATATPKSRTSSAAWRNVAVSMRLKTSAARSPKAGRPRAR
jgi:hypothetical protein